MPTEERMEAIVEQIELLMEVKHLWDATDTNGYPAWKGELPKEGQEALDWKQLDKYEQEDTLRYHIDWEGFTQAQEDDVIRRVIDGADSEFWMDGIEPDAASLPAAEVIALGAEIRADEHERRVIDYGEADAETYQERIAEGAKMPVTEYQVEFANMMRDIAVPPRFEEAAPEHGFDRQLKEAAERNKSRTTEKDRGLDR